MRLILSPAVAGLLFLCTARAGQSGGSAGTIDGTVTDPSGAAIAGATVELRNDLTRYLRNAATDAAGAFHFSNVPPNPYTITVDAPGFAQRKQNLEVRSAAPITLPLALSVAGDRTTVTVEAEGSNMIENVPYAHSDLDREQYGKLPATSPASGLSDAVTLASPGVVADSNGLFHPLGDHSQTSISLDGQPIGDQQSKQFSTQLPLNAIQSMELITGAPAAEFGDKTSLVIDAVTRSGLGQQPFGSFSAQYGSFGTVGENATFGLGSARLGNFLAANSLRSGRFLDTPEFQPLHDVGNSQTIFDRFDAQPGARDSLHVNLLLARNWFQVPNTYDQLAQDQRQRVLTFNVAPSYQHAFGAGALATVNAWVRRDRVSYYPSRDPFADTPATIAEGRTLTNYGLKTDLSYVAGRHNIKIGAQAMQSRLWERFNLGITDPGFNPVCVNSSGAAENAAGATDPAACGSLGLMGNPGFQPGLLPYDLTRGGSPLGFAGHANINEFAFYVQDTITLGGLALSPGLRIDRYNGLSTATAAEPRLGFSYLVKATGTVLRGAYSRTLETPYNENLVLSSSTGAGGLALNVFGAQAAEPIRPGVRNQFNAGLQQAAGKLVRVDADYFWKFTDNAFDFGALLNTPIVFPISWRKSKIDGVAVRVSTVDIHGFQAYTTLGHTRARFFAPSNGGLIFDSPLNDSVFRIDHDEAFEQTTNLTWRHSRNGPWAAFTWRYDSGLVAGAVSSLSDALALTAAQQAAIGFYCGSRQAAPGDPITSCGLPSYGATRLQIPAPGTANADHNPPRIAPRHLLDAAVGTDNLFQAEKIRTTLKFTVTNLTNTASLYNFLSTFSGTHFVAPRSYQVELGWVF